MVEEDNEDPMDGGRRLWGSNGCWKKDKSNGC